MKLVVLSLLVLVVVVNSEKKSSMLLGADDLDKKMAVKLEGEKTQAVAVPKNLREIKRLAKDDRMKVKEMQTRARALKQQMVDKSKSKSEQKALKKQYRDLKKTLHTKKEELFVLKKEIKEKKQAKRAKHSKNSGNKKAAKDELIGKDILFMQEKKELSVLPDTTPKPVETTTAKQTVTPALLQFNKKAARRKSQRKNEKKANKKNRNKNKKFLNQMQSDQPVKTHPKKVPCNSDADCTSGMTCLTNKRGRKHCRYPHGTHRAVGKKCHASEQCAPGLKCFVVKTAAQAKHKKHPRRGKGTCADPATTDESKGTFIPFRTESKQ